MIRSEQAAGAHFFVVTNDTALGLNRKRVAKLPCDEKTSLRVKIILCKLHAQLKLTSYSTIRMTL